METPGASATPMIKARKLTKVYRRGTEEIRAVREVSFDVERGEFVAVVGPSGSGKSTLLQMLGGMDTPTSGSLRVAGQEIGALSDAALTRLRRDHIGFVFQHFGLLPTLSVAENIALPAVPGRRETRTEVDSLLEKVGLAHRRRHRPNELSGGEMQRVAIARALINHPQLLLADEPTGNLDSATSQSILSLLRDLRHEGLTIVVVTHNDALAQAAERCVVLRDGRIVTNLGVL